MVSSIHSSLRKMAGVAGLVAMGMTLMAQARADGECAGGYRDTTPTERTAMTAAVTIARNAMPAAPEGWIMNGDDAVSIIDTLCRDYDAEPWSYGHRRQYQRIDDQDARNALLQEAANTMKADMAAKQPRLDAIQARMLDLSQQAMAAAGEGNYARVDELNVEIDAASAEYEAVLTEGDADDQSRSAQAASNRDLVMSVDIDFNNTFDAPPPDARPWSPAGVPGKVFRWSNPDDAFQLDEALILLGNWVAGSDGMYHFPPSGSRNATRVQSITLRVRADADRIEPFVGAINFAALQGLMNQH